jgi:phosphohistidine phosphatase
MGKVLKKLNIKPDIIISSPAKRAIDTAKMVGKHCGYNKQIETNSLLYASTSVNYLNIICAIPDEHWRALIVGHNPIIEELVKRLTNMTETIPTCTLIHINLNIKAWKLLESIDYRNINIINILKPKEIDI